jgi:hypothetical protein
MITGYFLPARCVSHIVSHGRLGVLQSTVVKLIDGILFYPCEAQPCRSCAPPQLHVWLGHCTRPNDCSTLCNSRSSSPVYPSIRALPSLQAKPRLCVFASQGMRNLRNKYQHLLDADDRVRCIYAGFRGRLSRAPAAPPCSAVAAALQPRSELSAALQPDCAGAGLLRSYIGDGRRWPCPSSTTSRGAGRTGW